MKVEIRNQNSESGVLARLMIHGRNFAGTLLLISNFCFPPSAFAGTHVTGTYGLAPNPTVMATVNGTPEYGLVFVQRSKLVTYNNVQYGTQVLEGYLDGSGELNDGAGNLWLDLIPSTTASPSDSYYVVTVNIQGQVHSEIWVVPDVATIDAAEVRQAQPPSAVSPSLFYQFVQQSGANLPQRLKLNILGSGVSCADDPPQLSTDCTLGGGSGGGSAPIASATSSGTVKTDSTVADPVVYLSSTTDLLLAGKAPASRLISTAAPLAGGGSLSSDLALSIPAASGSQNGYLAASDWNTFNSKENALTFSPPLSRSVNTISCPTCEMTSNKNAASGYAGLDGAAHLLPAEIPNPSATTLGGIESLAAVSHEWINSISTGGTPAATQPAFTDISGTATAAQIPNPAGDVTGTYAATTVGELHFGSIGIPLSSTAPTANQCLAADSTAAHIIGASCGSGGGGATLQTNGTNNANQTTLNLENGTGIAVTNPSLGNVAFANTAVADSSAAVQYVAVTCAGATACSDSNNGLTPGSAKATLGGAYSALPSGGGVIDVLSGSYSLSAQLAVAKPVTIAGIPPLTITATSAIGANPAIYATKPIAMKCNGPSVRDYVGLTEYGCIFKGDGTFANYLLEVDSSASAGAARHPIVLNWIFDGGGNVAKGIELLDSDEADIEGGFFYQTAIGILESATNSLWVEQANLTNLHFDDNSTYGIQTAWSTGATSFSNQTWSGLFFNLHSASELAIWNGSQSNLGGTFSHLKIWFNSTIAASGTIAIGNGGNMQFATIVGLDCENQSTQSTTCYKNSGTSGDPVIYDYITGESSGPQPGMIFGAGLQITVGNLGGSLLLNSGYLKAPIHSSSVTDYNGNPFILSSQTTGAVDSLTVTNAAAANPATVAISASGTDANINLNLVSKGTGSVECNGVACGSAPVPWWTYNPGSAHQGWGLATAGQILVVAFALPIAVSVNKAVVYGFTADATNDYSWGIYNSSGTHLCTTAAGHLAAGVNDIACSETTPVTLEPGSYIFAFTGNSTAGQLGISRAATGENGVELLSATASTTTSTGGALPASIVVPSAGAIASGWATVLFYLH